MFPKILVFLLMIVQLAKAGEESTLSLYTYTVDPNSAAENTDIQHIELLPNNTVCGISSYFDQFPWMALVSVEASNGNRFFFSGGILINERYVLAAAVAIKALLNKNITITGVRLGEYNTNTDPDCIRSTRGVKCAPSPIDVEVEEPIFHESFFLNENTNELVFDIALLRLKKEVEFTETVRPICLFNTSEERSKTYIGQKLTVAGWSVSIDDLDKQSFIKRKIQVPILDQETCNSQYNETSFILNYDQICAGGEEGRGVCTGDQGNPLMVPTADEKAKVHWYLVGMVSLGANECGAKDWHGIFTNISTHIPWIVNKLRP